MSDLRMTARSIIDFMPKNLKDTPFSIDRLFVWAVSIFGLIGLVTMCIQALRGQTIAPQIQSATMVCIGALIGRIERGTK